MNLHKSSCQGQIGYGLPTYKGTRYQKGFGVYRGQVFQRGHGLGGVLGSLFRTAIKPAIVRAAKVALPLAKQVGKKALPVIKKVGKATAQRAVQQSIAATVDAIVNKKNLKQNFKNVAKDVAKSTLHHAIKETQPGANTYSARKRKRKNSVFKPSKKLRKTIYD